jgi:aerobic carbon-monoxide dehydrogenase small subunit
MAEPTRFRLECRVNGREQALDGVAHSEFLLDVLRERLGLTGSKRSCDVEVCGACTVLLDGDPVSACTTLAWEARGRDVLTVEGLAEAGALDPIQAAFLERFAIQCGYCIPGMVMGIKHLLDEVPDPDRGAVRRYLDGNICRCTGYQSILEAIEVAAKAPGRVRRDG